MDDIKISLRACRVNSNLSIEKASKMLGITRQTLQNWESGRTSPTVENVKKICEVYNVRYDNIMF